MDQLQSLGQLACTLWIRNYRRIPEQDAAERTLAKGSEKGE